MASNSSDPEIQVEESAVLKKERKEQEEIELRRAKTRKMFYSHRKAEKRDRVNSTVGKGIKKFRIDSTAHGKDPLKRKLF